jgi:hypothetical protein
MPTQIIDASLHTTAFPATYIGPGNLIGNCVQANSLSNDVFGYFTSAGNAVQINCGFQAVQVDIADVTGVLLWHWQLGMPATNTFKSAAAALSIDTSGAVAITTDPAGNTNVTLSAATVGTGKVINFHIQG